MDYNEIGYTGVNNDIRYSKILVIWDKWQNKIC